MQAAKTTRRGRTWRGAAVLAASGLVLVTACTGDPTTSATPAAVADGSGDPATGNPPPPVFSAVDVPPGQIDAAVEQLPGLVETAMTETGVPGVAVAVVHEGEVVFAEGFGVRSVETGDAVDADTAFQIASLSKSVGATVISRSVGEGAIAWDDPIVEHLPGFELADPYVTERVSYADMYSHRSGLPAHIGDTLEDLGYDRAEVLERLRYVPLDPFRAQNLYTNFGITAAGQAAANAEGVTWEQLSAANLYTPLGMVNTTSSYQEFLAGDNRADLHVEQDGEWQNLNTRDPDAQSPAGGVSSSAADLARWMNLILAGGMHDGEQLVDAATLSEMLSPHSPGSPPRTLDSRPGIDLLGFNSGVSSSARVTFSHSGAFAMGAGTNFQMVPAEQLGIVVLTNGSPIGVAEAISSQFLDLALVGSLTQDWLTAYQAVLTPLLTNPASLADEPAPADPADPLADEDYVGTFANDYYGAAEVAEGAGGLVVRIGPDRTEYPLTHWDGNEFTWVAPGENSPGPSLVTFTPVPGGTGMTMEIVCLNEVEPLGVFTRA